MRLLAFSDIHRDTDAARSIVAASNDADVLVGAGDFATAGCGAREIIDIIAKADIPTVLVYGNHDNAQELSDMCNECSNVHLLHGKPVAIDGITFFGVGGEIPKLNDAEWNESLSENDAADMLSSCPERSVLVTHSPPFGCADLQQNGAHEGSRAVYAAIKEKQPIISLCGHIHYSWGCNGKIIDTSVHNLGPTTNWFHL